MARIVLAAALLPTAALAHGGPEGHAHPHGLEGALIALALAAVVGILVWRARR
jgi:hypothetical protein